jgi:protein-S-isoprenylcysteine O-methyltransferase Ste14
MFLGLIAHKAVWEILKKRDGLPRARQPGSTSLAKRFVKLVKVMVLVFIVIQTLFLKLFRITTRPRPLRLIGFALYVAGLATAIVGRFQLGKNWANLEDYQVLDNQSLVTNGIYRFIRHPIYTGDLLLLAGLELALNSWLVLGVPALLVYVYRQVKAEELVMSRSFPEYSDYQKDTKMFIPFVL